MARYIDADALGIGKAKPEVFTVPAYVYGWNSAIDIIEKAPTADVAEVKHGEWKHKRATIDGEHYFCCSECGREVSVNIYDNPSVTRFYPYCHCGAKMDERRDT